MVWPEPKARVTALLFLPYLSAAAAVTLSAASARAVPVCPGACEFNQSALKATTGGSDSGKVRYVLDRVNLIGNTKTRDSVVLRFIPFKAGDVLDVDDPRILLTQYRLLSSGLFRDVTLSVSRGEEHGHVVLNVELVERNTLVVNSVWLGVAASADTDGQRQNLSTFGGADMAEHNLFGTGISVGPAVAFSTDQFGGVLHFHVPYFLDSNWMLAGEARYLSGLGFFGNSEVRWDAPDQFSTPHRQAVVDYKRLGANLNAGINLDQSLQLWLGYRFERVTAQPPLAASHRYGGQIEPIDFHIATGSSFVSALKATLSYDTRDRPFLTRSGWSASLSAEAGLQPLGSTYSFQKLDLSAAHWWPLTPNQTLAVSVSGGAIAGRAPFFDQYYIGDLSDLLPSRILGLAFDDRPAPNLLGTAISEVRHGDYAARINLEYSVRLFRGSHSLYGLDAFIGGGLIGLATARNFERPPENRHGASLIPVDLNANLGLRLDTSLGGFTLSLANTLGFLLSKGSRE